MSLLQMSFSGAVLILAITVVRAVAINKLSKKTFLFLWGIALVRLLIPFSIQSTVSVYSLVDQSTYADTFEGTPMGNMIPIMPETDMEPAGEVQQANLQQQLVEHVPSTSVSVWFVIWCIGAVLCIALFAIIYMSWLMKFQTSIPVRNRFVDQWLKEHRLRRSISIRQSDRIDAPLTYGIFRPVILMPKGTDWEDTKKLQYILLHEYVHICRYDTVIKLIATLALCIHWFNPFVWVMYLLLNRDLELSCDESVVRRFGVASRSTYAHILISMEAKKSGLMPFYNSFSKNAIEERITSIMKIKKASLFAILAAVVLIISITSVFVTSAAEQSESQQTDAGSDELTVNTQLLQYLNMPYAQFKEQVGTEAEFYHGLYFQAPIAGNDANVVFQGIYDEEVAGTVISDNDKSFRVESRLNNIINGISKEMTVEEFVEMLDKHAGFRFEMYPEIQEGLTGYYVAYHYVEVSIDSSGDSALDIQLKIGLDESDHITPDASTWIDKNISYENSMQDDAVTTDIQNTDNNILIDDFWKEVYVDSNTLKFATGLEIIFPDSWIEKTVYDVDIGPVNNPTSTTLSVYEKTNAEVNGSGVVFYLHLFLHEEGEIQYIYETDNVLGLYKQGDKEYILILATPHELPYVEDNEECKAAYEELSSTFNSVIIKTDDMIGFTQYDNDDLEWVQYE